ncbi:MAG: geranylgeranylglyceryl/heptaprenylglyceryl phosphate synthase [Fibrobacterota bacterium]|nr:geranylgeranylglyceryl/heptaprenylglyceryl phosphate synthase [Fibrobacterota bacterium]QQS03076.1 MAG: geranylgeranylglyceryl/heptaprenylglyceryl phosphate synthase [Fibrobacterota bacterium]
MIGPLETSLLERRRQVGPLWAVLLDPDSLPPLELAATAREVQEAGADLLLVGGSSAAPGVFEAGMKAIRDQSTLPVVLFPGSYHQVVGGAHGILFTSLLSGRNPQYLAEEQVCGAPRVLKHGIEPIPTAYLLIESGVPTTVQKVSGTQPLPRDDYERVMHHVWAARMMGMRWVYLEAGSGAQQPVPVEMVQRVLAEGQVNLIVGGGLRTPEAIRERSALGPAMIVTGNVLEQRRDPGFLKEFAQAAHCK